MDDKMKKGYLVTGAALALASSALMLDVMIRKRAKKSLMVAGFFVGLAGIAAGAAVASYPKIKAVRQLGNDELFDIDDIDLLDQSLLDELGEDDDFEELPVAENTDAQEECVSFTEVAIEAPAAEIAADDDDDSIEALEINFDM